MQAAITAYAIGKFVHVLAVVVAFAPLFVYPVFAAVARRTAPRSLPAVLRGLLLSDRLLVTPGMVVLLAAGIYLLSEGGIASNQAWVEVGFAAVVVLFALQHAFLVPRGRRALELAERDLAAGDELSPELEGTLRQIVSAAGISNLIVAIAVFFMVVKP